MEQIGMFRFLPKENNQLLGEESASILRLADSIFIRHGEKKLHGGLHFRNGGSTAKFLTIEWGIPKKINVSAYKLTKYSI